MIYVRDHDYRNAITPSWDRPRSTSDIAYAMAAIAPDHASPSHRWCLPPHPRRRECHTAPPVVLLILAKHWCAAGAAADVTVTHSAVDAVILVHRKQDCTNWERLAPSMQESRTASLAGLPARRKVSAFQCRGLVDLNENNQLLLVYC